MLILLTPGGITASVSTRRECWSVVLQSLCARRHHKLERSSWLQNKRGGRVKLHTLVAPEME
jgi:hypothetical protein